MERCIVLLYVLLNMPKWYHMTFADAVFHKIQANTHLMPLQDPFLQVKPFNSSPPNIRQIDNKRRVILLL